MDNYNGLPTPTKVEAPLGTDVNGSEAKRDWPNSYDSILGMMLYLVSNTRLDNSFDFHQCAWFTHNTKASHETYVKRICRYLQGTKDKGVVLNSPKRMVANFYVDECFLVLWGHDFISVPGLLITPRHHMRLM